jgi:AcrR family transcriptional regulator
MKRSRDPRRRILDAAARAIARHGYHGMSMRVLAAETGQSLAAFYSHFSAKDEVLFEIQKGAFESLIASAQAALTDADSPRARLLAFIERHVRFVAEHPELMRVLIVEAGALPRQKRAEVRRLKETYYDLGRAVVAELHRDASDLEAATYGVFGMLNWTYGWYEPARHGTPEQVARSLCALALRGLEARQLPPEAVQ